MTLNRKERYETNGDDEFNNPNGSQPPPRVDSDGDNDSKSLHGSRDYERKSSKSREKERENGHDKERDRDRGGEWESDRDGGGEWERKKDCVKSRDRDRERDPGKSRDRNVHRVRGRDRAKSRYRDRDRDVHRVGKMDSAKSRYRDRDGDVHRLGKTDCERDRERDHDLRHRDHYRYQGRKCSERKDRGRDKDDNDGRVYDKELDDEHRHSSRSRSHLRRSPSPLHSRRSRSYSRSKSSRSRLCSRSQSRSHSKSKRVSGFDIAPYAAAMTSGAATAAGRIPSISPAPTEMASSGQVTKHAKQVYVGGIPPTANEQSVAVFFNQVMSVIGGNTAGPDDAVVNVYINHAKSFALVEMRSIEEASNAMALDGILLEGIPVKLRRPTDYNPILAATLDPSQPNPNLNLAAVGLTPKSAGGLEGPDRIFVDGLPNYSTETQIRELLESSGPLKGFNLVKDRETGNSEGYAFCAYQDTDVTDIACQALNCLDMGNKTLAVTHAGDNNTQPNPEQDYILMDVQQQISLQRLMLQPGGQPSKVVCLTQVVSVDELRNDGKYEDILDDMREECRIYVPRPSPNDEPSPGVGKVFLEYADVEGAAKARNALNGRKFGGNHALAVYYPENMFSRGDYEG